MLKFLVFVIRHLLSSTHPSYLPLVHSFCFSSIPLIHLIQYCIIHLIWPHTKALSYPFNHPSIHLFNFPFIQSSFHPSIHLPVHPSIFSSIHPSFHPSTHLFMLISIFSSIYHPSMSFYPLLSATFIVLLLLHFYKRYVFLIFNCPRTRQISKTRFRKMTFTVRN